MSTVLILFSDTGAGHRAAARALDRAMREIEPGARVELCDPLIAGGASFLKRVASLYPTITRRSPAVWGAVFHVTNLRPVFATLLLAFGGRVRPLIAERLADLDPDVVVSVHPLLNHVSRTAIQRSGRPRGLVTVVTDLVDLHRGWACPGADEVVVPTEEARRVVLRHRVPASKVRLLGLPVDLRFRPPEPGEKVALRRRYGLDEDRPTVLLTGGGEGTGRLPQQVRALTSGPHGWQVVVVCGRNEKLRRRLQGARYRTPTVVMGFVDTMPELLRAADLTVCRAGPGTIGEALATGVPIVMTGYLPGQETHNVRFVRAAGCGVYAPRPRRLLEAVTRLLEGDRAELRSLAERAGAVARRGAALDIAGECLLAGARYRSAAPARQ